MDPQVNEDRAQTKRAHSTYWPVCVSGEPSTTCGSSVCSLMGFFVCLTCSTIQPCLSENEKKGNKSDEVGLFCRVPLFIQHYYNCYRVDKALPAEERGVLLNQMSLVRKVVSMQRNLATLLLCRSRWASERRWASELPTIKLTKATFAAIAVCEYYLLRGGP